MFSRSLRIRRARTVAGLSQAQVAEQIGVRRSAVAQWECDGGTSPSVEHLSRLAVVTGMRFEWLATGRGQSRAEGEEFDVPMMLHEFAQDEFESRVLQLLRRFSPAKRRAACSILELL